MVKKLLVTLACFTLAFLTPGLTLAQTSTPYYISFEVVLRVSDTADLTALTKKVVK